MNRFIKSKHTFWLIIFAGLLLRLISLNQSLWLDEATTALVSKMSLADIFTKFLPGDFHPPLYYILMKGWVSLFGFSEIALRIPSLIFGLGLIFFVYKIAKNLFDKKTAIISSLLVSTSGLLIYYSQEARMYMLTALLVTAAVYFFFEKRWILFSVFLALIGLTDYIALFILPVFLIFSGKDFKKVVKSLIPLVLILAYWSPIFIKQLSGGLGVEKSAWWGILGTLSWKNIALIPTKFILGRVSFNNPVLYGTIAGSSILLYSYIVGKNILRQPLKVSPCKVILGWFAVPIILGIFVSVKIPVLYYFRFLFCLPALYILVAKGISGLSEQKSQLVLGIVLILNIFFSGKYLFDNRFHRENWRDISLIVGSDKIVFPANFQKEALTYYNKGGNIIYYKDFLGGEPQIWLSRYVWDIFDPNDEAKAKIEGLGYNKVQEIGLNGVEFWKYIKK